MLVLLGCCAASAGGPKVTRFTLSNGIRVVVLHVADCKHVAIVSYLPLGLAADGKGKTQWSHLIEHLTLRTTGRITDYRKRNGETMAQLIHLDFVGAADEWTEGLDLHAKWLSGLPLSKQSLREELPKALAEVRTTSARLYGHKWAFAAWNQVFRHGQREVAVLGDIQSARLGDLQQYRDRHLVLLDRVLVCVIGGIEPGTLKPALQRRLGGIKSIARTLPAATSAPPRSKRQAAAWDLDATHYIETYPIPKPDHKDYAAVRVAAALLGQVLFTDPAIKQSTGMVLCGADLITPEGAYFYVSASVRPGADVEKVRRQIERQLGRLKQPDSKVRTSMVAAALSRQASAPTDPAAAMRYKPAHLTEAMMLANIGLQWGLLEFQYGKTLPALGRALSGVSAADVASVARKYLSSGKRSTVILTPRKAGGEKGRRGS